MRGNHEYQYEWKAFAVLFLCVVFWTLFIVGIVWGLTAL